MAMARTRAIAARTIGLYTRAGCMSSRSGVQWRVLCMG